MNSDLHELFSLSINHENAFESIDLTNLLIYVITQDVRLPSIKFAALFGNTIKVYFNNGYTLEEVQLAKFITCELLTNFSNVTFTEG